MRLERWINELRQGAALIESLMAALEIVIIAAVGRLATWAAPLPSAILVGRAAGQIFNLAGYWPWVMAGVIELVGLACSSLWLTAREWNANKRKSDPAANERLALGLLVFYFLVTFSMLVVIELPKVWDVIPTEAAGLTSLLFPGLSAVALMALNERAAQSKRQAALDAEKRERSERRSARRSRRRSGAVQANVQAAAGANATEQSRSFSLGNLNDANQARQLNREQALDALVEFFGHNPDGSYSEAGDSVGRSKSWVSSAVRDLEKAGQLRRNGDGVEVLN